ncbi:MAG: hypothetical protein K0Q73_2308, partial [Paenibacillus sp.]|nr:hypothetical protein [Paenibacillus sp.]
YPLKVIDSPVLTPLLRQPGITGTGVGYADPDKPAR